MAHRGIFVAGLAADVIILGEIVRRLDHAADDAIAGDRLRHDAAAGQAVMELGRSGTGTPAVVHRIIFDIGHALDPAGDDDVGGAGLDTHGRVDHRLKPRTAAPVELDAGNAFRQTRRQRRPAADAGRLAIAIALGEDDIVDPFGIDPGALHQRLDDDRAQIAGAEGFQRTAIFADGGADGGDDGGSAHAMSFAGMGRIRRPLRPGGSSAWR